MAELSTLARPYAKAAFEYADAEGALEPGSRAAAGRRVVGDERVQALLADPALTTDAQAEAFVGLFGDEIGDSCKRYLRVLAENRA
jgi:F-type H+-transporting ATPase subunit delta